MIRIVFCLLLALVCVPQVDASGGAFFGFNLGRSSAFFEVPHRNLGSRECAAIPLMLAWYNSIW